MRISDELEAKIKKDFNNEKTSYIPEIELDYGTYRRGYLAGIKRFGGSCKRTHKEPWEGDVDRQGGSFTPWEKENATAWR